MSTNVLLSLGINVKKIRQTISHQQLSAFISWCQNWQWLSIPFTQT